MSAAERCATPAAPLSPSGSTHQGYTQDGNNQVTPHRNIISLVKAEVEVHGKGFHYFFCPVLVLRNWKEEQDTRVTRGLELARVLFGTRIGGCAPQQTQFQRPLLKKTRVSGRVNVRPGDSLDFCEDVDFDLD